MERLTNLALGWLAVAAFLTGWMAFAAGTPSGAWVPILHGMLGIGLLVLVPGKTPIARRGLRRHRRGRGLSVALAVMAAAAVGSGIALTTGWERIGPVTGMQVHVGSAALVVVMLLTHARRRPAGPADPDRRAFLRAGLIGLAAAALWSGWEAVGAAPRRFTGSHERGSLDPAAMPVVQWFDDTVQTVDEGSWRMRVEGRSLSAADLAGLATERVEAALDCTGGWFATQVWTGVRLDRLLEPGDARSVVVTSLTGYARRYPVRDLSSLWVAVEAGGMPLSPGHGHPARLVAPGRRGFWWVKWIDSVETSRVPWWVQSPFPLT